MPYIFDTNTIATLSHYYPKRFPSFWSLFDAAIEAEEVVSVREVLKELENHTFLQQWLDDWLDEHKTMFHIPSAKEMQFVVDIFKAKQFQALVGEKQRLRGKPSRRPIRDCVRECERRHGRYTRSQKRRRLKDSECL